MRNISSLFSFTPLIAMSLGAVSSGLWFGVKRGSDAGKELLGVLETCMLCTSVHTWNSLWAIPVLHSFSFYIVSVVCVYICIYIIKLYFGKKKCFLFCISIVRGSAWGQMGPGAVL